jgi:hypothetical protein
MDVDDAREVCEEEGLDAPEAASIDELRAILVAHFCEPVADLEPEPEVELQPESYVVPELQVKPELESTVDYAVSHPQSPGADGDTYETGKPSPRSAARRDAAWAAATQARKDRRVAMQPPHQPGSSAEQREIVWEEDPIERMKARRAEFISSKRAKPGDADGAVPPPPAQQGSPIVQERASAGEAAHEPSQGAERKRRLRSELERIVAEIEKLEEHIDEVLSSSSGSDSADSDESSDAEDAMWALNELEADLRRAQAHRSLIEQKLRGLELEAKQATKLRAAARRQAAIDARSKDLLARVRAGLLTAAGGEGDDAEPRSGSAARSLRRQM